MPRRSVSALLLAFLLALLLAPAVAVAQDAQTPNGEDQGGAVDGGTISGGDVDGGVEENAGDAAPSVVLRPEGDFTLERLGLLVDAVDPDNQNNGKVWRLLVDGVQVFIATDADNNRMRIFAPIAEVDQVDQERLLRLMQANFDTALDARYAIARGLLISVFIHPPLRTARPSVSQRARPDGKSGAQLRRKLQFRRAALPRRRLRATSSGAN